MKKIKSVLMAAVLATMGLLLPVAQVSVYADPAPEEHIFNNKAWFVWNCDGGLCRYQITDLESPDEDPTTGDLTYHTKYIRASDVKDVNDNTKVLDLNSVLAQAATATQNELSSYLFIFDDCIMRSSGEDVNTCKKGIDGISTWDGLRTWWDAHITDYDSQREFAIDPTGASAGKNIISTNGDRNFRATIYDETDYYGISNASSTADLTYYPSYWNTTFFNPAYDISETTLANPMIIQSYLLEPQVVLKNDDVSAPIESLTVASEGVPDSAVTITKQGDNSYKIIFNSNYYDKVVFRVVSGGKSYYVAIARTVVGHDYERNPVLYVPTGDTNEYDIIATYYWADGTEKTFTLEQVNSETGGKGLEARIYTFKEADQGQVDFRPDRNAPTGVTYISAKAGSTVSKYEGTLGGSNKGTYFTINRGSFVIDITK